MSKCKHPPLATPNRTLSFIPFQGPQGFQGNPGETGEPGPAVSVPNLAGLEHKPTHMTHS